VPDYSRTDLGAVSVNDDDSEPVVHKGGYLSRCGSYIRVLFFESSLLVPAKNCVPAEGEDSDGGLARQACSRLCEGWWSRRGLLLSLVSLLQSKIGHPVRNRSYSEIHSSLKELASLSDSRVYPRFIARDMGIGQAPFMVATFAGRQERPKTPLPAGR